MQFTCAGCGGSFEISRRAFGSREDTRTRCAACQTWLIVTRSADDRLTAVVDPALAEGGRLTGPLPSLPLTHRDEVGPGPAQVAHPDPPRPDPSGPPSAGAASPAQPAAAAVASPSPSLQPASRVSAPTSIQATRRPSQPVVPARALRDSGVQDLPLANVIHLTADAQLDAPTRPEPSEADGPPPVPDDDRFFAAPPPVPAQPSTRASQRLMQGADLFALPDPPQRANEPSRLQVSQAVQDFSVMVRLQDKRSHRRRNVVLALLAVAVGLVVVPLLQQKARYDEGVDAARTAKKLAKLLAVAYAEGEDVQVLPLGSKAAPLPAAATAGQAAATAPEAAALPSDASAATSAATTYTGTTLSRRVFTQVRQDRAFRTRRR